MAKDGLGLSLAPGSDVLVWKLVGRIDADQIAPAEEAVLDYMKRGHRRLVIDLSGAEQISSNGIGLMLYYSKKLPEKGGCLVVVKPRGHVARILEMTHLNRSLRFCDTFEEALEIAEQGAPSGADVSG
jgi:anti-anti-sigma factor